MVLMWKCSNGIDTCVCKHVIPAKVGLESSLKKAYFKQWLSLSRTSSRTSILVASLKSPLSFFMSASCKEAPALVSLASSTSSIVTIAISRQLPPIVYSMPARETWMLEYIGTAWLRKQQAAELAIVSRQVHNLVEIMLWKGHVFRFTLL